MAHADAVIDIAQGKLEQLVGQDAGGVCESKERMIGKDGPQPHGPGMQDALVAQTAEAAMAVDNLDTLPNADVAQNGKEGEDGGERGVTVDDEKGHVVDLEAVCEVADALAVVVGVRDDDDLVAAVDELARDLVDVRLDAAGLGEEEVADHGDVVRSARHVWGASVRGGRWGRDAVVMLCCRWCGVFPWPFTPSVLPRVRGGELPASIGKVCSFQSPISCSL